MSTAALKRGVVPLIRPSGQARGMATEKQILMRINSTRNIAKITKSMKMVSAAKMRGAQARLDAGRPFGKWASVLNGEGTAFEDHGSMADKASQKNLIIAVTSDRGLCGGVNSFIAKAVKATVADLKALGKDHQLFVIGDKGRGQLRRAIPKSFTHNCTETWKGPVSFTLASALAEVAMATEFDEAHILFNEFRSAISQVPTTVRVKNPAAAAEGEGEDAEAAKNRFLEYEIEPDSTEEVMKDLQEFSLATSLYTAMLESATSEESSRMSAMENATNNAEELVEGLTLVYNKARQSRITTELIEIISGATSLEG